MPTKHSPSPRREKTMSEKCGFCGSAFKHDSCEGRNHVFECGTVFYTASNPCVHYQCARNMRKRILELRNACARAHSVCVDGIISYSLIPNSRLDAMATELYDADFTPNRSEAMANKTENPEPIKVADMAIKPDVDAMAKRLGEEIEKNRKLTTDFKDLEYINQGLYEDIEKQKTELATISQKAGKLRAECDKLKAVVEKLPKTADGVPVVPGMTLYSSDSPWDYEVGMKYRGGRPSGSGPQEWITISPMYWYSSSAAAEAARAEGE